MYRLSLIVLVFLFACGSSEQSNIIDRSNPEEEVLLDQEIVFENDTAPAKPMVREIQNPELCTRIANFGDIKICLPKIEGLVECYSNAPVKKMADLGEVPGNEVIGYYVTPEIKDLLQANSNTGYDNYAKVYGTTKINTTEFSAAQLTEFINMMESSFIKKAMSELKPELEKQFADLTLDDPVLLETYKAHPNATSFIMLLKFKSGGGQEMITTMCINMCILGARLVNIAYYLNYTGKPSIEEAKTRNNLVVTSVLNANE